MLTAPKLHQCLPQMLGGGRVVVPPTLKRVRYVRSRQGKCKPGCSPIYRLVVSQAQKPERWEIGARSYALHSVYPNFPSLFPSATQSLWWNPVNSKHLSVTSSSSVKISLQRNIRCTCFVVWYWKWTRIFLRRCASTADHDNDDNFLVYSME